MGDLLTVGFSLKQALEFCGTLMTKQRSMIKQIDARLQQGTLFAESVRPVVKIDIYYQLLIAEQHGHLSQSITQLGQFLAVKQKQQQKLKGLLLYPVILVGLLIILLIALKLFIFPELAVWQTDAKTTSATHWPLMKLVGYGLVVGGLLLSWQFWQKWQKKTTLDKATWLSKLPMIGSYFQTYYAYYLISNLALLLQNGMGVKEICAMFNQFDRQSLLYQLSTVLDQILIVGDSPTKLVKKYPYLPKELIVFLNKGATTKDLGRQLEAFAKILFGRLVTNMERLLTLVQPLLFGFIAIMIVAMYLSIMLPIYQSMKGIY